MSSVLRLLVIAIVVVTACPAASAKAQTQPRCRSDEGALPQGMYWTTIGWYDRALSCPAPTVAVVEGVYQSARAAQVAVRGLPAVQFEPGFPWVVDARYAGLEADGVAVVLAWFEDVRDARRWSASRRRGHTPNLVRVRPRREALSHLPNSAVEAGEPEPAMVVWVPQGGRAYTFVESTDERGAFVPRSRSEACQVPPGSVFAFNERVYHRTELFRWMPVRCGRTLAWVERHSTSHEAVTWVSRDGRNLVTQVMRVECDTPSYTTWEIEETGRRVHPVVEGGSCGGP